MTRFMKSFEFWFFIICLSAVLAFAVRGNSVSVAEASPVAVELQQGDGSFVSYTMSTVLEFPNRTYFFVVQVPGAATAREVSGVVTRINTQMVCATRGGWTSCAGWENISYAYWSDSP